MSPAIISLDMRVGMNYLIATNALMACKRLVMLKLLISEVTIH